VDWSFKRKLAIGAAAVTVLGGGGAAYAVTKANDDNDRQAFLGDVAKRLNVTPQQLNDALKGAFEDRLQAAVKAGRLTQDQADQIKKKIDAAGGGVPFLGPGPGIERHAFGFGPFGPVKSGIDAAAKYLGLSDQQLLDKLRSGKSLADVAGDQNKSVDGLKTAIQDSVKTDLDAAVKAGKLTQGDENNILDKLNAHLDDLVNNKGFGPAVGVPGPFLFRAGPFGPIKSGIDGAAKYLGLTQQQLLNKLRSGKSLADVAGDQNKSVDGLKTAIKGSVKSDLDSAVKAGKLTQTQENKILDNLNAHLGDLVNEKRFGHPAGLSKRRFHFGTAPAGGPPPGLPIF
jgi:urease accessory protein UreF